MVDGTGFPGGAGTLVDALTQRGVSRRRFLQFCSAMTAALALPKSYTPRIVEALSQQTKPTVVWLEFQDCAGNTESLLRSPHPDVAQLVIEILSLNYHETIMAAAGKQAEQNLDDVVKNLPGKYVCVVEGSIPTANNGVYCTIAGRTALDIATTVTKSAGVVIAVGDCAWDGGFVSLGPTQGKGVGQAVSGLSPINLAGCPHNSVNLAATIVHYLTFGAAPALDQYGRPLFTSGHLIHDMCERRSNFDAGRFVENWGDEGARNGWCLYKMGCKGPATQYNCPIVRWNDGTNWPIGAGHGCIGCGGPSFWAQMSPFYSRLPNVEMIGVDTTAQTIGLVAIGGVAALTAVHGAGVIVRMQRNKRKAKVAPDGTVVMEPPAAPDASAGTSGDAGTTGGAN
jgi:hydrogenase small subunit